MNNGDKPAMPVKGGMVFYIPKEVEEAAKEACDGLITKQYEGLTKREHFAAMAMQGMLANTASTTIFSRMSESSGRTPMQTACQGAVIYADALLEALDK